MSYLSVVNELHCVRDYLRWAVSRFNEAGLVFGHGTDNAWDDAVQLVCYGLHLPLDSRDLLDARLTVEERQRLIRLIDERVTTRKPVAYITHRAWFAGVDFYVDERVLIPRSPIAELIHQQFAPWVTEPPTRILDLCTGSGCIAIASALAFPEALVDAVDIDEGALQVARKNVERFNLQDQVQVKQSDLFSTLGNTRYDLIVTNPPYVSEEEIAELAREFQHEPKLGLFGHGLDGLNVVQKMLREAAEHLTPQGVLVCEVGYSEPRLLLRYPSIPFTWVEFEAGGQGVFVLTAAQLQEYQAQW
nr:n5-glutamine s-adenosyl-l-methionine-dependent methyltransferase [uncultured bacterium]